jgi:hypothetical protein
MISRFIAITAALAASIASQATAAVIHVDADALVPGDGRTWGTAFRSLTDAVAVANAGDEIWIAEGTYQPTLSPGYFILRAGVKLYGGFSGIETSVDQRDLVANLTTIDGDLDNNDLPGFVNRSDNAVTLIEVLGADTGTRLDGLIFQGGYANTGAFLEGGAVRAFGGELIVDRCIFLDNGAMDFGGALYLRDMDRVLIRDSVFTGNSTNPNSQQFAARGGGVWFRGGELVIEGSQFVANQALGDTFSEGGAIWAEADVIDAERSLFLDNYADHGGGAGIGFEAPAADFDRCRFVRNALGSGFGGGLYLPGREVASSTVRVHACEFLGNAAGYGAALQLGSEFTATGDHRLRMVGSVVAGHVIPSAATIAVAGDIVIRQSTIAGNLGPIGFGTAVLGYGETDTLVENSIIWGNLAGLDSSQDAQVRSESGTVTANHSIIGGWDGTLAGVDSFDANPMFLNPDGPDGQLGTLDDDYGLAPYSPAIDAGSNPLVPLDPLDIDDDGDTAERLPLDVYGDPRRRDDASVADTGVGNAPIVDIGAAEYQFNSCVSDLNGDGVLDLGDITLFVTAFTGVDGLADLDGNGLFDLGDIVLFVGFFNAGCP